MALLRQRAASTAHGLRHHQLHSGLVRGLRLLLAPDDVYIPGDVSRRSELFLDRGRVVELPAGTHWVIQEEPQQIGTLLADFFRG